VVLHLRVNLRDSERGLFPPVPVIPEEKNKEDRAMSQTHSEDVSELNAEYRRLLEEHQDHERRLEALAVKSRLSEDEEFEEKRLKKEKLLLKDRMEAIVRSQRNGVTH
jgi:uncharacterized protein YdcH (DUF465 family)